jgi:hypothetical protein
MADSAAYTYTFTREQQASFESWATHHMSHCGPFPEVSGARWTFSFTPSGIVMVVFAKCLKCGESKEFT